MTPRCARKRARALHSKNIPKIRRQGGGPPPCRRAYIPRKNTLPRRVPTGRDGLIGGKGFVLQGMEFFLRFRGPIHIRVISESLVGYVLSALLRTTDQGALPKRIRIPPQQAHARAHKRTHAHTNAHARARTHTHTHTQRIIGLSSDSAGPLRRVQRAEGRAGHNRQATRT